MVCFWVVLAASTATAGSHPAHTHHALVTDGAPWHPQAPKAVSPFEVEKDGKRIHCELLGHNPLLPCPHHKIPAEGKDAFFITNDCGGGPFPAPSLGSMGGQPRFLVPVASADDGLQFSVRVFNSAVLYDSLLLNSLDRPPRAL